MAELDRVVAGVRCREVLADLSDYVDGQLPDDRVTRIQMHLRECDWCERFGGEFSSVVKRFRDVLSEAEPLSADVAERLRDRLREEFPEASRG